MKSGRTLKRSQIAFCLTLFLLSVLIVAPAPKSSAQTTTVSVSPSYVTAVVGEYFTINITISNVLDLYGWEFKINWSTNLVSAINVNEGKFLKAHGNTFFTYRIDNTLGYMVVDCTLIGAISGVSGDGTLATITFSMDNTGGCTLDLNNVILLNSFEMLIPCETTDGYCYSDTIAGDINQDGKVDMKDIGLACKAYGSAPGDPRWNPNTDVNSDGKVDMKDLGIICKNFGKYV